MNVITQHHITESIASALQYISYYHPEDFISAMVEAYDKEESEAAKNALKQVLINSRMCALGKRPICQDTGIVIVFAEVGMDVKFEGDGDFESWINEGVKKAYLDVANPLRGSVLVDPDGARKNTGHNAPAVIHTKIVAGEEIKFEVAAKGGGSEAKAKFTVLNPSDSVVDWVLDMVPTMGSGWCPPGILGIGIGGTPEKAMVLAKEAMMEPINIKELQERGASNRSEELRLEIYDRVNNLGIGAQGLGGLTTVLDVKVKDFPTHAANKPVAVIPNCTATRHIDFTLDGSGPAEFTPPNLDLWPEIAMDTGESMRSVNVDNITKHDLSTWQAGETLLLSGSILTGRDAAHNRISQMVANGEELPVDFTNRFIYYVGPVDPVGNEVVGPAGPTTATRMDKFTRTMLRDVGIIGMIGKAERGDEAIEVIREYGAVSLIAVGGAAYLVSQAIKSAKLLAFEDLKMEGIYEFVVEDMPVVVAVDAEGNSVHKTGPIKWQNLAVEAA